jgi:lysine 2,3-aminomutase
MWCRAWCTPTRTRCSSWSPTSAPPTAATACARGWSGRGPSPDHALWERALDYIRAHPEIRDVLLSGGDPLIMADDRLEWLLQRELRAIPHVEFLRIGTKVPAVLPQRITPALCRMLRKYHPLFMSLHFVHPDELTPRPPKPATAWPTPASRWAGRWCCCAASTTTRRRMRALCNGLLKDAGEAVLPAPVRRHRGLAHFRTPVAPGSRHPQACTAPPPATPSRST